MSRPFRRRGRGESARIQPNLGPDERDVLVSLLSQVHDLLDDGTAGHGAARDVDPLAELVGIDLSPGPVAPPEDPAIARLLPEGHREDPELAGEFRRLTERGLRQRKQEAIRRAVDALEAGPATGGAETALTLDQAQALLVAMTDVRLVLAERLGLRTDEDASRLHAVASGFADEDHPWAGLALLYDVLTWWQESLVEAVAG
ncbi:MAG: DUF2017 domain-containing protein [Actinomycetales bacterium]|nr:DUF2017 domain-containing protein [Actinomycetales bacterium]